MTEKKPCDMRVIVSSMGRIDFHAHLEPTVASRQSLLASMDKNAISQCAVVAGGVASVRDLSRQITLGGGGNFLVPNRALLDACAPTEGRLMPFYFANPFAPIDEYRALGPQFFGLKLGPAIHGVALIDVRNRAYLEVARTLGHCVYLHCLARPGFDIAALVSLLMAYPEVPFVLGHAGIGNCDFFAVDAIAAYPNAYFETSGGFSSVVRYALQTLGHGRLLFGSEYPLQDPSLEIYKTQVTGLSENQLNDNARRLLRQGGCHV